MPFGADFETDIGNSGSIRINYQRLYLGEATQANRYAKEETGWQKSQ